MFTKITQKCTYLLFLGIILTTGCKKDFLLGGVNQNKATYLRNATTSVAAIKIATYNVHLFLGVALKDDDARMRAIQQYLGSSKNNNDVVFFQEIWKDVTKNELINSLKDRYPFSYHTNSVSNTIGDGLLILSKFPMSEHIFYKFNETGGWDFFAPKGFIKNKFSTPNGDFVAFSTHTNSDAEFAHIRAKQFEQIKSEAAKIGNIPSVIVGDLNVIGETDEYTKMCSIFSNYRDTFREIFANAASNKGYTFDNDKNKLTHYFYPKSSTLYQERLDYILVSKEGWETQGSEVKMDCRYNSASLGNEVDCSDHYLYQTTLVLTQKHIGENAYIADSYATALKKVNDLKSAYGTGLTAKIILHNNTNQPLNFYNKTSWYNSTFYNVPAPVIPAGKFAVILASHDTGEATGVFNQLSYKLGAQLLSFGVYVPWSWAYTNNVLVGFEEISQTQLDNNSTRPSISKEQNGIKLEGKTATGDSPLIEFKVSK